MRSLSDITHVGRTLDPRNPTVQFALVVAGAGAVLVWLLDTDDLGRAVATGLATFAAWAIARELDPDRPRAAGAAAVLTPLVVLLVGTPAPAALFVTLFTTRVLVRTTGLPPKSTDLAVIAIGATAFAHTAWGWAAGILLAFAIVRDVALPGEPPLNAGLWGAALAVGVTARVALADQLGVWEMPSAAAWLTLVLGLVGAAVVVRPVPVLALGDFTNRPLEPGRLREGALFGILTAALSALVAGHPGIVALAPLLAVYAAVAAVRLTERVPTP